MRKISLWASIISAIAMITVVAAVLPDTVPIHFDIYGNADMWGGKWTYVLFALIPSFIAGSYEIYRKKVPDSPNVKTEERIVPVLPFVFIIIGWLMIPAAMADQTGVDVRVLSGVGTVLGLLMIYISNLSGKIRQNRHLGIRLPWTLGDEANWKKTHRLGGFTGTIGGIIMTAGSIIGMCNPDQAFGWCVGSILIGVILVALVPAAYSFMLYLKSKKQA